MLRTKLLVLMTMLFATGCNKKDGEEYTGGKGGSGRLLVTPVYNGKLVDNVPVYLWWQDLTEGDIRPGYDDTAYCVQLSGKPVAIFDSLKAGQYTIVAGGKDSAQNTAFRGLKTVYLKEGESLETTLEVSSQ